MHFLVEMFPRVESAALRRILDEVNNHLDDAVMHCLALEETTAPAARDDDGALRDEEEDQPESMVSLMPPSQVDPDFDSTQAIQLYGAEEEGSLVGDGAEEAEEKDEMAAEAAEKSDSAQVVDVSDDDVQFVDWPGASSPAPALTPIHDAVRSFCDLLLADGSSSPASSAAAAVSLRVLHRALDNVLQHAHVDKYRVLPIAHANFRSKIGGGAAVDGRRQEALLHRAKVLLVRCGFTEVSSGPDDKDAILLLSDEDRDATRIQLAARLLQEAIQEVQTRADAPAAAASTAAASSSAAAPAMPPVVAATTAPGATTQPGGFPHAIDSTLYMPLSRLKREIRKRKEPAPAATKRVPRITRDEMAERVTARLEGRAPAVAPPASAAASSSSGAPSAAAPAPTIRAGRVMDLAHMASLRAQIATVRRAKHRHWSTATADRKRVFTVDDLAGMEEADLKARAQFAGGSASAAAPAGGAGGKKFRTLADFEVRMRTTRSECAHARANRPPRSSGRATTHTLVRLLLDVVSLLPSHSSPPGRQSGRLFAHGPRNASPDEHLSRAGRQAASQMAPGAARHRPRALARDGTRHGTIWSPRRVEAIRGVPISVSFGRRECRLVAA